MALQVRPQEVLIQNGHSAQITCLQYAPDKSFYVTGDESGTIKVWDSKTFKIIASFLNPNSYPIRELNMLDEGNTLIERSYVTNFMAMFPGASSYDSIGFYDLENMKVIGKRAYDSDFIMCQPKDTAFGLLFGINQYEDRGSYYYCTGSKLFFSTDSPSLEFTYNYVKHSVPGNSPEIEENRYPGNKKIITLKINDENVYIGFLDGTLEVRRLKDLQLVSVFKDFDEPVANILLSKNIYASYNGYYLGDEYKNIIKVRDINSNETLLTIKMEKKGRMGLINNLSISDDERYLAVSRGISEVQVFELPSGKEYNKFGFYWTVNDVDFMPNQPALLVAGDELFLIDVVNNLRSENLNNEISTLESCFDLSVDMNEQNELVINYPTDRMTQIIDLETLEISEISLSSITAGINSRLFDPSWPRERISPVNYSLYNTPYAVPNWLYEGESGKIYMLGSSLSSEWSERPAAIMAFDIDSSDYSTLAIPLKRIPNNYFSLVGHDAIHDQFAVTDDSLSNLYIIDKKGNEIYQDHWLPFSNQFSYSASFNFFGYIARDSSLAIIDSKRMKMIRKIDATGNMFSYAFYNESDKLVFSDMETVKIMDLSSGKINILSDIGNIDLIGISPDDKSLLLVSNWKQKLYLFDDGSGEIVHTASMPGTYVLGVTFHPDNELIALRTMENSIQVFRTSPLEVVCTVLANQGGEICFSAPDGYYFMRKKDHDLIAFRKDKKVVPVYDFDLRFNRPDIILERLGLTDEPTLNIYRDAYAKRLRNTGLPAEEQQGAAARPVIGITNRESIPWSVNTDNIDLEIKAVDDHCLLDRLDIMVNNVPVFGRDGISLKEMKSDSINYRLKLSLSPGINKIKVSCRNEQGAESYGESMNVSYAPQEQVLPDLYLVVLSVGKYDDPSYNLSYTVKDGRDIASMFINHDNTLINWSMSPPFYQDIHIDTLFNEQVTRKALDGVKARLGKSTVDDMVLIYLTGHGLLNSSLDFYFATHDMDFGNPGKNGIPFEDIEGLLDGIPARKRLILIDACQSGVVDKEAAVQPVSMPVILDDGTQGTLSAYDFKGIGTLQSESGIVTTSAFDLLQELFIDLSSESGAVVISAAAGMGFALEGSQWNNGAFTYAVLNGLQNLKADKDQVTGVTVTELRDYLVPEVERITNGAQRPSSRQENLEYEWRVW